MGTTETAEITVEAREHRFWQAVAGQFLPPFTLGVLLIGVWYFISYVILDEARRFLLKPPHEVIAVGFLDGENFAEMMGGLWSSTKVAMVGLAISIVVGVALAVAMSQSKLIERAVFPYAVTLQAIPILAIVPLLGFWFGYQLMPRVVICVIISIFPIIVNTLFGLLSAQRGMHDLFTLHHASRWVRLRKLMFPASLPALFTGLRIAAGLSVIGAIVGDFFFGRGEIGIGQLLLRYANRLQGEQLLASIIVSSALGVAVFLFFGWLQQRVTGAWDESGRD
ncbi:MAG: ABC transporter permease [Acidimicrobiia bacterium]